MADANNRLSKMVAQNAEATVIATALKHPEFTLHSDMLKPGYFYNTENGCLLWAIQELYKRGIDTIDALNLKNILESNPSVSNVMKSRNITDINTYIDLSRLTARDTIEEYMLAVQDVVTMAYKRDMYKTLTTLNNQCLDEKVDLRTLETNINKDINAVTEKFITSNEMALFGDAVDELWHQIENERNEDGSYGVPTIFPTLTKRGLVHEKGELILLMAQRKVGKSTMLLNDCIEQLKHGMGCIYHDTEMSDKLFMIRMLANVSGVEQIKIKKGSYNNSEAKALKEAMEWIKQQRFIHIFAPVFNEMEIYNQYKIFMYKYGSDIIGYYDYFKGNEKGAAENYNQLGNNINFMKNEVAGELEIPIMAAAQLNRDGKVADSYKLEMYASAGITYKAKTSQEILDCGGLKAGNCTLHLDFARSAEPMGDDEILHISVDGARMRVKEAEVQPRAITPFDDDATQLN